MPPPLPLGLYEALLTRSLADAVAEVQASDAWRADLLALDEAESPEVLAAHVAREAFRALSAVRGEGAVERRIALTNDLLEWLGNRAPAAGPAAADRVAAAQLLSEIAERGSGSLGTGQPTPRPGTPLRQSALLVNAPGDLRVGHEIVHELASADRVDLLCAFLRRTGVLEVRDALKGVIDRRGPGSVRILTTVYTGATERRAVDDLARMGCDVRVSYETAATRLHAKAWLFDRASGFSTGLVGSSNLSRAALRDGLEWNVRLAEPDNGRLLERFRQTFEHYWGDPAFEAYDPERHGSRLAKALRSAGGRDGAEALFVGVDVEPRPYQQAMLERLDVVRAAGRRRSLVVAATGTGKTWLAAFDYARLHAAGEVRSLLFVAHREQILQQARAVFRIVLRQSVFGELLGGGQEPVDGDHVFAMIQSLRRPDRLERLAPDAYDMVVVDEFHHAEAQTYVRVLDHLKPRYLLGLTATPERTDALDVTRWTDGVIDVELRLWTALDQGLVAPFQYFGVTDGSDLSDVGWKSGRYVPSELEDRLLSGHDLYVKRVLDEVADKVTDPGAMRALGFCVGVRHAQTMADRFTRAGLESRALHQGTPEPDRRRALDALQRGDLRCVFAVDLLNEGIDVPAVDTVLLLRPTDSATVFLQQLGRGLRRTNDKACVTVLDFIGQHHRSFRFDRRLRAILGGTRRDALRAVDSGFPRLPPGCSMQLDRVAREQVLENIRASLRLGRNALVEDLRHMPDGARLPEFLARSGAGLDEVYARPAAGQCFTELRERAGRATPGRAEVDDAWLKSPGRMLHVDDPERCETWRTWLLADAPPPAPPPGTRRARLYWMLLMALGQRRARVADFPATLAALWPARCLREEVVDLLGVGSSLREFPSRPLALDPTVPLHVHARYARSEVMAAFGQTTGERVTDNQLGVAKVPDADAELLFVTLEKSDRDFSPTTQYADRPLSPTLFQWESQSVVRAGSDTEARYVHHERDGHRIVLFVRHEKKDDRGETLPFLCLGPVTYVSHTGDRPLRIRWRLHHPAPAAWFETAKVAAG